MHIVFLTSNYYPTPSPNGILEKQYCDMLCNGNNISVICFQNGSEVLKGAEIDGTLLYSVNSFGNKLQQKVDSKPQNNESSFSRWLHKVIKVFYKPIRGLRSLLLFPSGLRWYINKAYKQLEMIDSEHSVDCICAVSSPFAAFLTGLKWKKSHPDTRFITFTLDTYATSFVRNRNFLIRLLWEKKSVDLEKAVFSCADFNFITIGVKADTASYQCYPKGKTQVLPNLIECQSQDVMPRESETISLMYCGSFYKKIRNPQYLLDALLALQNVDFRLDLYIDASCEKIVDSAIAQSQGKFVRHAYVSPDEIQRIMRQVDCLIDIGNKNNSATPSKTFQYIATGRPIILFAPDGYKSEALERYPLSLIIMQSVHSAEETADMIKSFCLENRSKRLCMEEINSLYPEHMWNAIMEQIRRAAYNDT